MDEAEWFIELDVESTDEYRNKEWYEIKKELYETKLDDNWYDREEFLANYCSQDYISAHSKPLVHIFTSALKND